MCVHMESRFLMFTLQYDTTYLDCWLSRVEMIITYKSIHTLGHIYFTGYYFLTKKSCKYAYTVACVLAVSKVYQTEQFRWFTDLLEHAKAEVMI